MDHKVVTANRLDDGRVVYLTAAGWVTRLVEAEIAASEQEVEGLLVIARAAATNAIIVEPYAIDIEFDGTTPLPVTRRERIRAGGPTVGPVADHATREEPWPPEG